MTALVTIPFADGEYRFHLTDKHMLLLELGHIEDRGCRAPGPFPPINIGSAYARLLRGRYELDGRNVGLPTEAAFSVTEMNAITRAALLGGGGGVTANGTVISWDEYSVDSYIRKYLDPLPLVDRWDLCLVIMGARVEGLTNAAAETAATDAKL